MPSALESRIIRGVGSAALGQAVNAGIQLISLPLFLSVWGVDKYGEWLILSSLAMFLSMSDIGFATAASNEITMHVAAGRRDDALAVYHTMWALLSGVTFCTLTVVLTLLWITPLARYLPVDTLSSSEAVAVLSCFTAFILIGLCFGLLCAGFRCEGRFATGQLLMTVTRLAEFMGQAITAWVTRSMVLTVVSGLMVRFGAVLLFVAVLKTVTPWLTVGVRRAKWYVVRRLAVPALSFLGLPLGHAISNQGIVQVVASTMGAHQVVVFSAHRTAANVVVQLMTTINHAIWPELSHAFGAGNIPLARQLHRQACQWSLWLGALACLALAFVAPVAFPIWSQGEIRCNSVLLATLMGVIILRSTWLASSAVPIAINRHEALAAVFITASVVSCIVAWTLIKPLGIVGAAIGPACADIAMGMIVMRISLALVADAPYAFLRSVFRFPSLGSRSIVHTNGFQIPQLLKNKTGKAKGRIESDA